MKTANKKIAKSSPKTKLSVPNFIKCDNTEIANHVYISATISKKGKIDSKLSKILYLDWFKICFQNCDKREQEWDQDLDICTCINFLRFDSEIKYKDIFDKIMTVYEKHIEHYCSFQIFVEYETDKIDIHTLYANRSDKTLKIMKTMPKWPKQELFYVGDIPVKYTKETLNVKEDKKKLEEYNCRPSL